MAYTEKVLAFIMETAWEKLPRAVQHQAKRCLLDNMGAMIAGHGTPVGQLMARLAAAQFSGDQAAIVVSGRRVSAAGAALANGFAANALDIDDGYRKIKGHPGVCVLPALLAAVQRMSEDGCIVSGKQFLTTLAVGYEVGIRAGLIRHATCDTYHSSGSWGAVAGAAAAGRVLGLTREQLWHALGAADYHAPMAPMMKCITTPSMGKDSIGWGSLVGIVSALMAREGFTGIAPLFDNTPEPEWIDSLGSAWEIENLYFKPHACCRWAQPGVDGTLKLVRDHGILPDDIEKITVYTFAESAALRRDWPKDTEQAQYNIAFPIAAALLDGQVGPAQVLPPRLLDDDIHKMMNKIDIIAQERFQKQFPDRAESEVEIRTRSGHIRRSGVMSARWDPATTLPADQELIDKFFWLAGPVLGEKNTAGICDRIFHLETQKNLDQFFRLCVK
ncbi:MAG: MmgE/PrpD family protein [Desulfotignum sp.]|nr:MmgE/PrpD family protein [Desulfotignum sp.]MCF8126203.1 MmgE/PrpD family protein [Desulfotignum sp.]